MDSAPRVTVAVPSRNHARYLDQALASVFSQRVPVEVYVADAGSTDGSVEQRLPDALAAVLRQHDKLGDVEIRRFGEEKMNRILLTPGSEHACDRTITLRNE